MAPAGEGATHAPGRSDALRGGGHKKRSDDEARPDGACGLSTTVLAPRSTPARVTSRTAPPGRRRHRPPTRARSGRAGRSRCAVGCCARGGEAGDGAPPREPSGRLDPGLVRKLWRASHQPHRPPGVTLWSLSLYRIACPVPAFWRGPDS